MFVFQLSLWFCTILFHLCKLCKIVDLFLGLIIPCFVIVWVNMCNFILPCMVWKKHDIWCDWAPHERSIILLGGVLYHLSPKKNMTFIELSPLWEKYYFVGRRIMPFIPLQKTWHLVDWVPHGRGIILLEGNYIPFIPQENIAFNKAKSLVERRVKVARPLVYSPITHLIFKLAPLQLRCRWSLIKIKWVIGFVDVLSQLYIQDCT